MSRPETKFERFSEFPDFNGYYTSMHTIHALTVTSDRAVPQEAQTTDQYPAVGG
jgi:hypothetical protein